MLDKANEVRQLLIEEIEKDVVGPRFGDSEVISEWPTSAYLAGILFPRETRTEPDEDEEFSESDDDDSTTEKATSSNVGTKPSSMGLTCRIEKTTKKVLASIKYGMYDSLAKSEEDQYYIGFSREPFFYERKLDLENPDKEPITLSHKGIELRYSVREFPNEYVLSVFLVNNIPPQDQKAGIIKESVFQPSIVLSSLNKEDKIILDDKSNYEKIDPNDSDSLLFGLLFNSKKIFGIGHSCSVEWNEDDVIDSKIHMIKTTFTPKQTVKAIRPAKIELDGLDMKKLYSVSDYSEYKNLLMPIVTEYREWIQKSLKDNLNAVPSEYQRTGENQIKECEYAASRIENGIKIISNNEFQSGEAFKFANLAMAFQQSYGKWAKINRKKMKVEGLPPSDIEGKWYLFQIAFFLMNIQSIVKPKELDHEIAELLWFPTGGGKTEAYLGIIAFTIALRRLRGWDKNENGFTSKSYGVTVIMRYTLRLLTIQQFQRAASLMCACEFIRRREKIQGSNELKWGYEPFYVGLWVGSQATPNTLADAENVLTTAKKTGNLPKSRNPVQLIHCPWCGAGINQYNYDVNGTPKQCRAYCSRSGCPFSKESCVGDSDNSLPVLVVDEDIYSRCPSLLIATVDKFAQIAWKEKVAAIFGQVNFHCTKCGFARGFTHPNHGEKYPSIQLEGSNKLDPPELIVQDELHLIAGPLGTLTGLYETAIDVMCSRTVDGKVIGPKIIASTATTKTASDQILCLFNRNETRVFPPQGFSFGNSFFAEEISIDQEPGKIYLGLCATAKSGLTILAKISAAVLRKVRYFDEEKRFSKTDLDPYYTLVSYFNSIREMGGAYKMYEDSVPGFMQRIHNNVELRNETELIDKTKSKEIDDKELESSLETQETPTAKTKKWANEIKSPVELTSRVDSGDIPEILSKLEVSMMDGVPEDLLLSTNMLSVGVDIPRLGAMIINGQPKNHSEYIQASGRIGRKWPGLIITSYNYLKPRDLSHYENFKFYHSTFFKNVESVSLTPFSARSRDRGLFGILVGMVRLLLPQLAGDKDAQNFDSTSPDIKEKLDFIRKYLEKRVDAIDSPEKNETLNDFNRKIKKWDEHRTKKSPLKYAGNRYKYANKAKKQNEWYLLRTIENDDKGLETVPLSLREAEKNEKLWYLEDRLVD